MRHIDLIELPKSLKRIPNWRQWMRLSVGTGAALCVGALLAACATSSAVATDSSAASATGTAETAALEDTFRSFTACDAGFFKSLHDHANAWAEVAPLGTRDGISWIKVKDRYTKDGYWVNFSKPPVIAGLKFLSYHDSVSVDGNRNFMYTWGFIVEEVGDEAVQKFKTLVNDSNRLHRDNNGFTRIEYKVDGSQWLHADPSTGAAPDKFVVRRMFVISPNAPNAANRKGVTFVGCNLVDMATHGINKDERPDIDLKDYPDRFPLAEDMAISANVIESLDGARAGKPLWMPKFKKLSYTTKRHFMEINLELTTAVEVQPNGLILSKEENSHIKREWLTFGGLVTIKAKTYKDSLDNSVSVASQIKFELPAELKPSVFFTSEAMMDFQPPIVRNAGFRVIWRCKVKERFDAQTIFSALSGKAARVDCTLRGGENMNFTQSAADALAAVIAAPKSDSTNMFTPNVFTQVYLENLGIFVDLGKPSADGSFPNTITQMQIER